VGNPALWQSPAPADYTPGNHRGNWYISIGKALGQWLPAIRDTTGGTTIAKAFQRIRRYKAIGQKLILENNAPAIVPLNQGHSTQAPAGFIQQAEAIARNRSLSSESKEL
jgi:hypothetical protein